MRCKICNKEFEEIRELTEHLVKEHKYNAEQLYTYYGYSFEAKKATCPICGMNFTISWRQLKKHSDGTSKGITCGRKCSPTFMNLLYGNPSSRPDVKEKKRQKALEKYGVENVFQAKEIKEKSRQTNLEKYGVEYVMQSKEIRDNVKETNIKKYGVEHISQREDIKEKKKKKSLEKYGVSNISQAEEVKEKKKQAALNIYGVAYTLQASEIRDRIKQTNLEKYGVEYVTQAEEIKNKIKETNLERYGHKYIGEVPEIKEKIKQSNMEKYGVEYSITANEVKDKIKETLLERFGVERALQSSEVRNKIRESNLEKYGVENISQLDSVKEKVKRTNLERYGVENPLQSPEIKEKSRQTNVERYGVEYAIQSEEIKEKVKRTNLERYGVEHASQSSEVKERRRITNMRKYGVPNTVSASEIKNKIKETNMEKYGVEYFCQHEKCLSANPHRVSVINKKFSKLLNSHKIENELEFILENYGYDLRVEGTLIEIDPYFTHNSTIGPCFGGKEREPKPFDYHLNKTLFAKERGYNCVHIFDWDDKDKVVNLLKKKEEVYARRCLVKEVGRKEVKEFLEKYHLQGSTKQYTHAYGLYYNEELVEVMTFGKPRYNKDYEYELLRLCTTSNLKVVGGANKLLKCFEANVKPKSIISYCDLSKFSGRVYEKLGFTLKEVTKPAKHWYHPKTKRHITDNLLRQRGFDQLHGTCFGKGSSNEWLMLEHGYVEIFDCGQLVFTKQFPNSN